MEEDNDVEGCFPKCLKVKEIQKKLEMMDSNLKVTDDIYQLIVSLIQKFCCKMIKSGCEIAEAENSKKLEEIHLFKASSRIKLFKFLEKTFVVKKKRYFYYFYTLNIYS